MTAYHVELTTPLFSRGAYDYQPEVRPPSIRGQLRAWFRALGCNPRQEKAIFGGVHGDPSASRVVVRVSAIKGSTGNSNTLPHKSGANASPKQAFQPGTSFTVHILTRLAELEPNLQIAFDRALESWLLLGTLGLRGTRAAGSFRWEPLPPLHEHCLQSPVDFIGYERRCKELLQGSAIRFALLSQVYPSAELARRVVSDTLGGRDDSHGQNELFRLRYPLGKIGRDRKTSPLRFRIASFKGEHRIAAIWDGRESVTGNRKTDLAGIIALLATNKPDLGVQLQKSDLQN